MTKKSELGAWGEDRACEYLVENDYRIIDRNFRKAWGEIDIVAKYKDGTLVFVEVKTVNNTNTSGITAEDQMTNAKIRKFKKAALLYAGHRPELVNKLGWRLDLITLTKSGENFTTKHYQNI
ncbi:MAG TPA: YraN family protein [Candidatus Paceibacterota bacterium]|nr:YraN family protein [Candidatus Paceibacterota bacterium]